MYKNITQEFMSEFCEKTTNEINKLRSKNEISQERIASLELKNEKYENIILRLSIMNEKVNLAEQKVNDLNKIMMKHFAYRGAKPQTQLVQPIVQPSVQPSAQPSVQHSVQPLVLNNPLNTPTVTLLQNPFQFNPTK